MEQYCERTFVGPMLASLEALRIRDVHTDHIASHVGQMLGIVSRLKCVACFSLSLAGLIR